jgi:hypothetical protein
MVVIYGHLLKRRYVTLEEVTNGKAPFNNFVILSRNINRPVFS